MVCRCLFLFVFVYFGSLFVFVVGRKKIFWLNTNLLHSSLSVCLSVCLSRRLNVIFPLIDLIRFYCFWFKQKSFQYNFLKIWDFAKFWIVRVIHKKGKFCIFFMYTLSFFGMAFMPFQWSPLEFFSIFPGNVKKLDFW